MEMGVEVGVGVGGSGALVETWNFTCSVYSSVGILAAMVLGRMNENKKDQRGSQRMTAKGALLAMGEAWRRKGSNFELALTAKNK